MANEDYYHRIIGKVIQGPEYHKSKLKDRAIIEKLYGPLIVQVMHKVSSKYSVVVAAALVKCALIYGEKKTLEFCDKLKDQSFDGQNDPARLLWHFLLNSKSFGKKNEVTKKTYLKTVHAARAFCEGRTLSELRISNSDFFEWEPGFIVPPLEVKTNNPYKPPEEEPDSVPAESKKPAIPLPRVPKKWNPEPRFLIKDIPPGQNADTCACGTSASVFYKDGTPRCGRCYLGDIGITPEQASELIK